VKLHDIKRHSLYSVKKFMALRKVPYFESGAVYSLIFCFRSMRILLHDRVAHPAASVMRQDGSRLSPG
jgi:hypothetical protein